MTYRGMEVKLDAYLNSAVDRGEWLQKKSPRAFRQKYIVMGPVGLGWPAGRQQFRVNRKTDVSLVEERPQF
jgi:hypothetical protein